jgi:uncharacterized protein Yka (UPF0111/DUF47 family)
MPPHDPIQVDDPGRRRNVYDATIENAVHAGSTDARLDALGEKIDALAQSIDKRFEQIDRRFERLEDRFDRLQLRIMGGLFAIAAALIAAPHL